MKRMSHCTITSLTFKQAFDSVWQAGEAYMLYIFYVEKSLHLDICYLVTNVYD